MNTQTQTQTIVTVNRSIRWARQAHKGSTPLGEPQHITKYVDPQGLIGSAGVTYKLLNYPYCLINASTYDSMYFKRYYGYFDSYKTLVDKLSRKRVSWIGHFKHIHDVYNHRVHFYEGRDQMNPASDYNGVEAMVATKDNHIMFPASQALMYAKIHMFIRVGTCLPLIVISRSRASPTRVIHPVEYKRLLEAHEWPDVLPVSDDKQYCLDRRSEFNAFNIKVSHEYFPGIKFDMVTGRCVNPGGVIIDKRKKTEWRNLVTKYRCGIKIRLKLGIIVRLGGNVRERRFWETEEGAKFLLSAIVNRSYDVETLRIIANTHSNYSYVRIEQNLVCRGFETAYKLALPRMKELFGIVGYKR